MEKNYDLAAENGVNVSLPALDAQIDTLLESTNTLLDAMTSATRNSSKLSANLNPTSENIDWDGESPSNHPPCHPHCLSRWNNRT